MSALKEITARQSRILNLLEEGPEVMADKGFLIEELLKKVNEILVIPPFLGKTDYLLTSDVTGNNSFDIHLYISNSTVCNFNYITTIQCAHFTRLCYGLVNEYK